MTEHAKPAQVLAQARQRIVAELDKAQQATANLGDEVAARNREIAKWLMRSDALLFALDALGPAPVPRGRKRAASATVAEKPKRGRKKAAEVWAGDVIARHVNRTVQRLDAELATAVAQSGLGVVQETAAGEKWAVDVGIDP